MSKKQSYLLAVGIILVALVGMVSALYSPGRVNKKQYLNDVSEFKKSLDSINGKLKTFNTSIKQFNSDLKNIQSSCQKAETLAAGISGESLKDISSIYENVVASLSDANSHLNNLGAVNKRLEKMNSKFEEFKITHEKTIGDMTSSMEKIEKTFYEQIEDMNTQLAKNDEKLDKIIIPLYTGKKKGKVHLEDQLKADFQVLQNRLVDETKACNTLTTDKIIDISNKFDRIVASMNPIQVDNYFHEISKMQFMLTSLRYKAAHYEMNVADLYQASENMAELIDMRPLFIQDFMLSCAKNVKSAIENKKNMKEKAYISDLKSRAASALLSSHGSPDYGLIDEIEAFSDLDAKLAKMHGQLINKTEEYEIGKNIEQMTTSAEVAVKDSKSDSEKAAIVLRDIDYKTYLLENEIKSAHPKLKESLYSLQKIVEHGLASIDGSFMKRSQQQKVKYQTWAIDGITYANKRYHEVEDSERDKNSKKQTYLKIYKNHLLPINTMLLDRPTAELYNHVYQKLAKELKEEDWKVKLAKISIDVIKKGLGEVE